MSNKIVQILRDSLKEAHDLIENTMKDVTEDAAHVIPSGRAQAIAPAYAHAVISEDFLLNSWILKGKALSLSAETGLSAPMPAMDENWEKNNTEWMKTVKMDLTKFKEFAQQVYKNTDKFLEALTDEDLTEKKVDMSAWGMEPKAYGSFIIGLFIGHAHDIAGEISAIKGTQGLKGYPY